MDTDKALRDLNYIKEIVSSASYTNLSGVAGIIAGFLALAGSGVSVLLLGGLCGSDRAAFAGMIEGRLIELGLIWGAVLALACAISAVLTIRKAKRARISPWSKVSRQVFYAVIPGLLAGAALTVYFIMERNYAILPPIWMLTYGVAVSASGMFSVTVVRALGWAFIISSFIPLLILPGLGLVSMAVSFGGYHIIYGIIVFRKYGG